MDSGGYDNLEQRRRILVVFDLRDDDVDVISLVGYCGELCRTFMVTNFVDICSDVGGESCREADKWNSTQGQTEVPDHSVFRTKHFPIPDQVTFIDGDTNDFLHE